MKLQNIPWPSRIQVEKNQRILKSESARNFRKTPICEISNQKEPIFFQENRLLCFICFLCLVCLLCRGLRRSRPAALPSIGYRGFAVAPMTLRAPARRFSYNPGCRVETLLVLMGVMGFLGDLREDRSRARPVGGSARRSIPSEREQPCCDL